MHCGATWSASARGWTGCERVRRGQFGIPMSNLRSREPPVTRYVEVLLAGTSGPRGEEINMRGVASRVAALCLACAASTAFGQSPPTDSAQSPTPQAQRDRDADRDRTQQIQEHAGKGPRSFTVTWKAPDDLRPLFEKFLPPPKPEEGEVRRGYVRSWVRDVR